MPRVNRTNNDRSKSIPPTNKPEIDVEYPRIKTNRELEENEQWTHTSTQEPSSENRRGSTR
jgi:hypothetical protein